MEKLFKDGTNELTDYGEFVDRQLSFFLPLMLKIIDRNEMNDSAFEDFFHNILLELLELTSQYPNVNEEELRKKLKDKIIKFASKERKNLNMIGLVFNTSSTADPIEEVCKNLDEQAFADFIFECFQSFSTVERGIILDGLLNDYFDHSYIECITSLIMLVKGYYWVPEEFLDIDDNSLRDFIEEVILSRTMVDSKRLFIRRKGTE